MVNAASRRTVLVITSSRSTARSRNVWIAFRSAGLSGRSWKDDRRTAGIPCRSGYVQRRYVAERCSPRLQATPCRCRIVARTDAKRMAFDKRFGTNRFRRRHEVFDNRAEDFELAVIASCRRSSLIRAFYGAMERTSQHRWLPKQAKSTRVPTLRFVTVTAPSPIATNRRL